MDIMDLDDALPAPALMDADAAAAAAEVSPTADEVEGRGEPLLELIERGEIDAPEQPLAWTAWTRWRSLSGQRPRSAGAFSQRESRLWRTTMEALFGPEWRQQLALPQPAALLPAASAEHTEMRPAAQAERMVLRPAVLAERTYETRAEVEPPGHFQLDDAASSADSEGSWRDTSSEDLERMLKTPFRPGVETLQGFERRLSRSRAVLALRGIPTNHAEIQRLIHVARLAERYRVNGGIDALNRDMEEELDCDGDDIRLDELLAAAGLLGNGVRRAVRPTSMLQPAAAPAAAAASDQPKRNLVTQFEDVMSEASEKSELIPADLVRTLLSHLDKKSSKKSTIQIRPDVTWPSLSDLDQDIETFFEELDDICDLANDADGMSDIERLRVLGNCLKQSRKKVYRVKLKEARASGLLKTDPGKVFEEIRVRLMEFRESALEKQNRVENEYQNLTKGNLSALQFLPQFESLTSEMDICGVGLSERQLLLGYLRKVGADQRREILKDRRLYSVPTGGPETMRAAATWREAHRILLEFDAIGAGTKALVAAVGGPPAQTRADKRTPANAANRTSASAPETSVLATEPAVRSITMKDCLKPRERRKPIESPVIRTRTKEARVQARIRARAKARARARMRPKKERRNFASAS